MTHGLECVLLYKAAQSCEIAYYASIAPESTAHCGHRTCVTDVLLKEERMRTGGASLAQEFK